MTYLFYKYSILFIIVTAILIGNFLELWNNFIFDKFIFAVGILSARDNFIQREIARSTWLKKFSSDKSAVMPWFIIGNSSCHIPPDYRLSQYSCEKWNINVSGSEGKIYSLQTNYGSCLNNKKTFVYQGFSFKVNHPIVVTKLGMLAPAVLPNVTSKLAILDIQSKEVITQVIISDNAANGTYGYVYFTVENVLFPKGYEGLVLFEGYTLDSICSTFTWNDGGGAITFSKVYLSPYQLDSKQFSIDVISAISFEFFVNDLENLKAIVEKEQSITANWNLYLKEIQKKIESEKSQHQDLFIADSMDIYRNLPMKMLKFYKWLNLNYKYSYIMKTDDDSVVNIELLHKILQEETKFNKNLFWLWSKFRKGWPVNYVGKWADHDYKSTYYPSFPCGATYILSHRTVSWLSENSGFLYPYQGEDVSLGIWLSAINADLIEDENFECDSSCSINSYNRAQLTTDEIKQAWSFLQMCNNLCTCENI